VNKFLISILYIKITRIRGFFLCYARGLRSASGITDDENDPTIGIRRHMRNHHWEKTTGSEHVLRGGETVAGSGGSPRAMVGTSNTRGTATYQTDKNTFTHARSSRHYGEWTRVISASATISLPRRVCHA